MAYHGELQSPKYAGFFLLTWTSGCEECALCSHINLFNIDKCWNKCTKLRFANAKKSLDKAIVLPYVKRNNTGLKYLLIMERFCNSENSVTGFAGLTRIKCEPWNCWPSKADFVEPYPKSDSGAHLIPMVICLLISMNPTSELCYTLVAPLDLKNSAILVRWFTAKSYCQPVRVH